MKPDLDLPIPTCWGPPAIKRIPHGLDMHGAEETSIQGRVDGWPDLRHIGTEYGDTDLMPACFWARLDMTADPSRKYTIR